jgi:hypothetical protein
MAFPTPTYRTELPPVVRKEVEQFAALTEGYLGVEHTAEGHHGAITCESITVTGGVTAGSDLEVAGDVVMSGDLTVDGAATVAGATMFTNSTVAGAGAHTFAGRVTLTGELRLSGGVGLNAQNVSQALTGSSDIRSESSSQPYYQALPGTTYAVVEITSATSTPVITGIRTPAVSTTNAYVFLLINASGATIRIAHHSSSAFSLDARIQCPGGVDYYLQDNEAVWCIRTIAGAGGGEWWYLVGPGSPHLFRADGQTVTITANAIECDTGTTGAGVVVRALARAYGTGAREGSRLFAGRNTSGSGAAGTLGLEAAGGTDYSLWVDANGRLRLHTAPPTEDNSTVSDTAGQFVGVNDYVVPGWCNQFSPSASTTYYFGLLALPPTTTAAIRRVYLQKAGRVTRIDLTAHTSSLGSAESVTVAMRLNNTSDTTITSSLTLDATYRTASATTAVTVAAGDYVEIKVTTPAWGTPPGDVTFTAQLYVET